MSAAKVWLQGMAVSHSEIFQALISYVEQSWGQISCLSNGVIFFVAKYLQN